jgi:hypothetical protein
MNLTSCTNCGVVLDKNQLLFPEDFIYTEDEEYDDAKVIFYNKEYRVYLPCPVCAAPIVGPRA